MGSRIRKFGWNIASQIFSLAPAWDLQLKISIADELLGKKLQKPFVSCGLDSGV